jgi:hypothetical protein
LAEGLILRAETPKPYRDDPIRDKRLDRLYAQGHLEEWKNLLNGKQPRVQLFADATINEEDS